MHYKRIKNGKKIEVKDWQKEITITDVVTRKVLAVERCSDHIKAILVAKAL